MTTTWRIFIRGDPVELDHKFIAGLAHVNVPANTNGYIVRRGTAHNCVFFPPFFRRPALLYKGSGSRQF